MTKTGSIFFIVGVVACLCGLIFNALPVADGTGPNIGAALLLMISIPMAASGALIGLVGLILERKKPAAAQGR